MQGYEQVKRGCVLVLGAGRGRRMGGPKALMNVAGGAWWQVQSERIAATGRAAAWVVSAEVRRALEDAGAAPAMLIEADADAPMFASVLAGVSALRASAPAPPWIHVLPVDVPAPAGATLELLEGAAGPEAVSVPMCAGRSGHPVCLSWRWVEHVLLDAAGRGSADRLRLDELVAPDRVVVRVCDPSVTVNLNTPADVEEWIRGEPRINADERG